MNLIYALLATLIISGSGFLLMALTTRDYLLAIVGVAMISTGVWILVMAVGA